MSLKTDKDDCHAKAWPDEELFTLRAKDGVAPSVVRLWVAMRLLDAFEHGRLNVEPSEYHLKLREALDCADRMRGWWERNPERRNGVVGTRPLQGFGELAEAVITGSDIEAPAEWYKACVERGVQGSAALAEAWRELQCAKRRIDELMGPAEEVRHEDA